MCVCVYETPVTQHCPACWRDPCLSFFSLPSFFPLECSLTRTRLFFLRDMWQVAPPPTPYHQQSTTHPPSTPTPLSCNLATLSYFQWVGATQTEMSTFSSTSSGITHALHWLGSTVRPEAWAAGKEDSFTSAHLFPLWLQKRMTINTMNSVKIRLGSGQDILPILTIQTVFKKSNGQFWAKESNHTLNSTP